MVQILDVQPGGPCLQGHKFVVRLQDPSTVGLLHAVLEQFGGELILLEEQRFYRLDIRGIGLMTGILSTRSVTVIYHFRDTQAKRARFEAYLRELELPG